MLDFPASTITDRDDLQAQEKAPRGGAKGKGATHKTQLARAPSGILAGPVSNDSQWPVPRNVQ